MKKTALLGITILMGLIVVIGLAFVLTFSMAVSSAQEGKAKDGKAKDGKAIFLSGPCPICHSISVLGIKNQAGGKPEFEAPDLSKVGVKRTAAWMAKWLLKEETIDGKKHEKRFKGTSDELETVTKWLETLKPGTPSDTTKAKG